MVIPRVLWAIFSFYEPSAVLISTKDKNTWKLLSSVMNLLVSSVFTSYAFVFHTINSAPATRTYPN